MNSILESIINEHMVRRTRAQKSAFIELIKSYCDETGWSCTVESNGISRNIVIGDPDQAEIIYTAHYDTSVNTFLPYLLAPAHHRLVSGLMSFFGVILFISLLCFFSAVLNPVGDKLSNQILLSVLLITVAAYYFFGIPNRNNMNDNTSGILTLLAAMERLDPRSAKKPVFVFFDNEEKLFLGSRAFRKRYGRTKPLINFDCVADGENILLTCRSGFRDSETIRSMSACFSENAKDFGVRFLAEASEKTVISSDHKFFPLGIGVSAFNRAPHLGFLYFSRIHSRWDTRFREENIKYLAKCICDFHNRTQS